MDPAEGRYVNRNYESLSAAALRAAAVSKNPDEAYLSVAKRMPVRMSLVMDQRKLNSFIVECGNSPLTVEVRQVRFNRSATAGSGASEMGGFGGPGPRGGGEGFGGNRPFGGLGPRPGGEGFGGNPPFGGPGGGNAGAPLLNPHPWDRPVEIYGIVYIYNPPDTDKLKLAGAAGASAAVPGAPAVNAPTTPAPAIPAPAPVVPVVPGPAAPAPALPGPAVPAPAPAVPGPAVPPPAPAVPAPAPGPPG